MQNKKIVFVVPCFITSVYLQNNSTGELLAVYFKLRFFFIFRFKIMH
jgi:hypothetical protein